MSLSVRLWRFRHRILQDYIAEMWEEKYKNEKVKQSLY